MRKGSRQHGPAGQLPWATQSDDVLNDVTLVRFDYYSIDDVGNRFLSLTDLG